MAASGRPDAVDQRFTVSAPPDGERLSLRDAHLETARIDAREICGRNPRQALDAAADGGCVQRHERAHIVEVEAVIDFAVRREGMARDVHLVDAEPGEPRQALKARLQNHKIGAHVAFRRASAP